MASDSPYGLRPIASDPLGLGMRIDGARPDELINNVSLVVPTVLVPVSWKLAKLVVTQARVDASISTVVLRFQWFLAQNPGVVQTRGPRAQIRLSSGKFYSLYLRRLAWLAHQAGAREAEKFSNDRIYEESIRIPRVSYRSTDVFDNTWANLKAITSSLRSIEDYQRVQERLKHEVLNAEEREAQMAQASLELAERRKLAEPEIQPLDAQDIMNTAFGDSVDEQS